MFWGALCFWLPRLCRFDDEVTATRTYDRVALQHGLERKMNIPSGGVKAATRGSSKYRGVSYHKQRGKWEAQINLPGRNEKKYLGRFDDEMTAALEYDRVALQHGLEDRMNFPPEGVKAPSAPYLKSPYDSSKYRGVCQDKRSGTKVLTSRSGPRHLHV
eukprot:9477891-Pyramimonas_sp.AAC.4